jgi:hypothetical protein
MSRKQIAAGTGAGPALAQVLKTYYTMTLYYMHCLRVLYVVQTVSSALLYVLLLQHCMLYTLHTHCEVYCVECVIGIAVSVLCSAVQLSVCFYILCMCLYKATAYDV